MKRLIKKTIEFFKRKNKLESKEVPEAMTLDNSQNEPERNCYISRGYPNWVGLPSDHLEKGTRAGFLRYYEEDVEKMKDMTKDEVITYKRQLRKEGKYTIDDSFSNIK